MANVCLFFSMELLNRFAYMRITVTRQCFFACTPTPARNINSLWPSQAIWWHRLGSTQAQVMALLPYGTKPLLEPVMTYCQLNYLPGNSYFNTQDTNLWNGFENYASKNAATSPKDQWILTDIPPGLWQKKVERKVHDCQDHDSLKSIWQFFSLHLNIYW